MVEKKKEIIIEVRDLMKSYTVGNMFTPVLKGISFKINKGEFVAIMGPSGSGKSTTLHQLALLDEPTDGAVLIDSIDVNRLSEDNKANYRLFNLGYVFQEYRNIPELTILENVYLPLKMQGMEKEEYLRKATEILEIVGLKDRLGHHPYEISGGQQQRVAIARALVTNPIILFSDEATANLDTASGDVVMNLYKKLNKELGQTIVMVTHEPEHVKFVDRVIYIKDGYLNSENKKF